MRALKKSNIKAEIIGREKAPYSIWKKMKKKNINFEQLSDVMAFKIIVDLTLVFNSSKAKSSNSSFILRIPILSTKEEIKKIFGIEIANQLME